MTDLPSLMDPAVQSRPYDLYRRLRDEHPVYRMPETGFYVVTRYDDVRAASVRVGEFSSRRPIFGQGDPELEAIAARGYPEVATITSTDPPEHTRFR